MRRYDSARLSRADSLILKVVVRLCSLKFSMPLSFELTAIMM